MHTLKRLLRCTLLLVVVVTAAVEVAGVRAAQGKFDKLSEADRQALSERFQKEIWPLMVRHGKDGCVGCHQGNVVSSLRMSGDPAKDFRMLVADGYLLKGDAGSMLERMRDKDPKRHMPPPPKRIDWTAAEIKVLEAFVEDLHKKNR